MTLYRICFSPTGGTRKAVDEVAGAWNVESDFLDLAKRDFDATPFSPRSDDVCVIGVPSFGGRVPATALERLATLEGNGAAAVLVAVYGNRAFEDTLVELADAARSSGFRVVAGAAAVAEHSIMRQFAAGRPDAHDAEELRSFGERIAGALKAADPSGLSEPSLPGNRPYRAFDGVPFKPKANSACTNCGLCARSCPVGAIPADAPDRTDKDACISCMRCVADCPQRARTLNKVMLFVAGRKMAKACGERKENELFLA